jgi:hypothetical protein
VAPTIAADQIGGRENSQEMAVQFRGGGGGNSAGTRARCRQFIVNLTVGPPGITGDEDVQEMIGQRLVPRLGETARASNVTHYRYPFSRLAFCGGVAAATPETRAGAGRITTNRAGRCGHHPETTPPHAGALRQLPRNEPAMAPLPPGPCPLWHHRGRHRACDGAFVISSVAISTVTSRNSGSDHSSSTRVICPRAVRGVVSQAPSSSRDRHASPARNRGSGEEG